MDLQYRFFNLYTCIGDSRDIYFIAISGDSMSANQPSGPSAYVLRERLNEIWEQRQQQLTVEDNFIRSLLSPQQQQSSVTEDLEKYWLMNNGGQQQNSGQQQLQGTKAHMNPKDGKFVLSDLALSSIVDKTEGACNLNIWIKKQ